MQSKTVVLGVTWSCLDHHNPFRRLYAIQYDCSSECYMAEVIKITERSMKVLTLCVVGVEWE